MRSNSLPSAFIPIQKQFCSAYGVNYPSFVYHRMRLRKPKNPARCAISDQVNTVLILGDPHKLSPPLGRPCEERSDEAIQKEAWVTGLLRRCAPRKDGPEGKEYFQSLYP